MPPRAALEQEAAQGRLLRVAQAGVRRAWRSMRGRRWETAWNDDVGPKVTAVVVAAQAASAARSDEYVTSVLEELNIPTEVTTRLLADAFAGVAGDGRDVDSLAYGAVIKSVEAQYTADLARLTEQARADAALMAGDAFLQEITASILADTARAAEVAALAQRPWVTGYIRMIEDGACSRCAILAGRFYLFNEGFLRHPACRCVHIPYAENQPHDSRTNPHAYFESLTEKQQDQTFTRAGAEAIRLGADPLSVVNARRGMTTAQQNPAGWIAKGRLIPTDVHGRPTFVTTEGVTKRGTFGWINKQRRTDGKAPLPVRLMPESIMRISDDPAERVRLLKLYGYIA